jgi:ADP-ribose pyrophosphatase
VHTFDTVHILALPTDRTVLVVHEYRPIWRTKIWQLPSGKADKEQDIVAAAQRELREETGYRANSIEPYYRCHHWDRVDYACNVFIARDLVKDALPKDDCESMDAHELPIIEAIQKVLQSPYIHTVSLATLLRYAREHGE